MLTLKTAITIVEGIAALAAALLLGDYVGYKFGRMALLKYTLFALLGLVIIFVIYAAIRLNIE
jgi:hypothetical protein